MVVLQVLDNLLVVVHFLVIHSRLGIASQILETAAGYQESASDTHLTGSGRPQKNDLLKAAAAAARKVPKATTNTVTKNIMLSAAAVRDGAVTVKLLSFGFRKGKKSAISLIVSCGAMANKAQRHNVNFQAHKTKQITSGISIQMQHSSTLKDLLAHLEHKEYLDDAGVRVRKI
ncbi:hypothetical protein C8J56DRAFT_890504 [Mycena floridula]|nr:hypothetical protein C8J56DRAFT_890504 [Mycena floridula]